jgi:hypothetical protein
MYDSILIPNTFFSFMLNSRQMDSFPIVNMVSVGCKRFWRDPANKEFKDRKEAKRRKSMIAWYKKPESAWHREQMSKANTAAQYKRYAEETPEEKEARIKHQSDMQKASWAKVSPEEKRRRCNILKYGRDVEIIEKERINTFAGIITESQMRELMDEG